MPRLPDYTALGERPTPQPEMGTVGLRTGQEAAALAQMAETISAIEQKLTRARRASDLTDALGKATEALGTKAIEYSKDQDFKTAPARFKMDAAAIEKQFGDGIQDRVVRDAFTSQYRQLAVSKQLGVLMSATKQEGDSSTANLNSELDVFAKQYAASANDFEREKLLGIAKIAIGERVTAGWITDVQGQRYTKAFVERAADATVMQGINDNAKATYTKLTTDAKWMPDLDPKRREELTRAAETRVQQVSAQEKAAVAQVERDAYEGLVQSFGSGKLTPNEVLKSDASPATKLHMLTMIKAQAKEALEKPIRKESSVFLNVLQDIRSGTITNEQQIESKYADSVNRGRGITWDDTVALRKELSDLRTPEGARLAIEKANFLSGVKASIDKSNPLLGKLDQSGQLQYSQFVWNVNRKVEEYKSATPKKDAYDLFNPSKPDYLGRPEALLPFQKTMQESLKSGVESLNRGQKPKKSLDEIFGGSK